MILLIHNTKVHALNNADVTHCRKRVAGFTYYKELLLPFYMPRQNL